MAALTLTKLQPLLGQFKGEGMVLSCYADLGVTEGFRADWRGPFEAGADALWKAVGEDGRARAELEQNLAELRGVLEEPHPATRWLAAFSSARRGFFKTFPLDAPVAPGLVMAGSPYLVPLLEAVVRRREYLAVFADTHRARLHAATPAGAELLDELDEPVPQKQHSAGETWGQSQATIARHREDAILHCRKELVRQIKRAWDERPYAGMILLGEHEVLKHLRDALPKRLAGQVAAELPESWYEQASAVEAKLRDTSLRLLDAEAVSTAEGIHDRLRTGRAVAAGPRAVLEAIEGGRFGARGYGTLVFGPDPREVIGRCTGCRALAIDAPAACPRCGAACAEANLWEELLLLALRHDIACRFVSDPAILGLHGGVVAMLPRAKGAKAASAAAREGPDGGES